MSLSKFRNSSLPALLAKTNSICYSVGTNQKQYLMPTWPSLWPGLIDGKAPDRLDTRVITMTLTILAKRSSVP